MAVINYYFFNTPNGGKCGVKITRYPKGNANAWFYKDNWQLYEGEQFAAKSPLSDEELVNGRLKELGLTITDAAKTIMDAKIINVLTNGDPDIHPEVVLIAVTPEELDAKYEVVEDEVRYYEQELIYQLKEGVEE